MAQRTWSASAGILTVALSVVLPAAGCATRGTETPADRGLFRLATVGPAPVAEVDVELEDLPAPFTGPPVAAYTTELRFVRADGVTVVAPRLTAFPGQLTNIQILNQLAYIQDFDVTRDGSAWVADPVIGQLRTGWLVELTVLEADGSAGEAALAYSVTTSDVRRPLGARAIGPLAPGSPQGVSIQLPRWESAEIVGARRLTLGAEVEIACLPDPSGAGDLRLFGRVVRVEVPGPAAGEDGAPWDDARPDDPAELRETRARVRALGAAAAKGSATGRVRVTAVRLPAGVADPEAAGVERLASLVVDSVLGAGATASNRLHEAYVADWDVDASEPGAVCDPVVATHDSGLTATVGDDGRTLRISWRTTPGFETFTFRPFERTGVVTNAPPAGDPKFTLAFDRPTSTSIDRTVSITAVRTVHPFFRLPDGGTAAVVVDVQPGE